MSKEEEEALEYGLDHYIPAQLDKRRLEVEFESFYQNILRNIPDLPEEQKQGIKTKFLSTFNNYKKIKAPYEYQDVVKNLSKNNDICLLKQDKGRGIIIMDRTKYVEKCMELLNTDKFVQLDEDPTASFETRVQNCLRGMKKRLGMQTYNQVYPTSSRPGQFYGVAKLHKLPPNSKDVNALPIRPIISNIGTATYKTSKYLAKLLSPLTKSEYTVESTKDFISSLNDVNIGQNYDMVSFDVSSLFTNVPLDHTINLILDQVYKKKRIKTKLKRDEMKQLLELCTKEMHFSFDGKIYKQVDGVCMGSPLGPVLANVFMVDLETKIAPRLKPIMPMWKRYVDDTFTFVKKDSIDQVIASLNGFHENIKFTHESEQLKKIPFLDVLITRTGDGTLDTAVYRKPTNNNVYIHWRSYGPKQWKTGTLAGIIRRAYSICSTKEALSSELDFIRHVFITINGYPKYLVESMLKKFEETNKAHPETDTQTSTEPAESQKAEEKIVKPTLMLKVPFRGNEGQTLVKRLEESLKQTLKDKIEYRIVHTGTKISRYFSLKDKTCQSHQSNIIYRYPCRNKKCKDDYVGETGRRKAKRTGEHAGTDKQSEILKHTQKTKHPRAKEEGFEILATNYPNRTKRKLAEAMFIRDLKPTLNRQKDSYKLHLFA